MTSSAGQTMWESLYYPWGQTGWYSGSSWGFFASLPLPFPEIGQMETLNRSYESGIGRWTSPDPDSAGADSSNPQSWNMYSYVLNNPMTNIDPEGLACRLASDGTWYDDESGGETCAQADKSDEAERKNPSTTVTTKPGSSIAAVGVNIGIGIANLVTGNANTFSEMLSVGQYSPNFPQIPAGSGVAANIGALVPLVAISFIGPEGEAEDLGPLSRELGVSINTLKHVAKHLGEFQKLDATADLRQVILLGQDIVRSGIQTGPRTFENTVGVGGSMVRVRAVLNYAGSLRSVYIVP